MQTYLFYDLETTGLSVTFDQILHFAAIRTDLNLKEMERYDLKIKLNPDVIPSPEAMITHQMRLQDIQQGISEWEAIKKIHGWINTPNTISIGYNTLGFDDEFLRFSFYRNLLPPYTHQYANQCSRMDLYPMAVFYFLYKKNVIEWPDNLKLEQLNAANQFVQGSSHDAMVDVEVTLKLAERFFQEKEMWNYLCDYFNKKIDQERVQPLFQQGGLLVSGKCGTKNHYQMPVLFLGPHRHYKNQTLWLQLDADELMQTTKDNIPDTKYVRRKKMGEPGFILPMEKRFLSYFSEDRREKTEKNRQWLKTHPELFQEIINYHCDYKYPIYPETDASGKLYVNGFLSNPDEKWCHQFHASTPEKKSMLANKIHNETLRTLSLRILGRHFPETMTTSQADYFTEYLNHIHSDTSSIDFKGTKQLTPDVALQKIAALCEDKEKKLTGQQLDVLKELEIFLRKR